MGDIITGPAQWRGKARPQRPVKPRSGLGALGALGVLTPSPGLLAAQQMAARAQQQGRLSEAYLDYAEKLDLLAGLAVDLANEGAALAEYGIAAWLRDVQHDGETLAGLVRARFHLEEQP